MDEKTKRMRDAAPDLFAALHAMTFVDGEEIIPDHIEIEDGSPYDMAFKAIEKATGESIRSEEPEPDYDAGPLEQSASYRQNMKDAGRGHLLP